MFLLYLLIKKFLGKTKFGGAQKNLGGIARKCSPWLQVWFRFSEYLAKPTLFDETK